jgi:cobaltochelatase CobS
MVPAGDEHYVFPRRQTEYLLRAIGMEGRNGVYISGPSGTGKTQLVLNVFNRLKYECLRINGDSYKGRSEAIGEWKVKGSDMTFQYGPLPVAMRRGIPLLVDELDMLNPHALAILRPALEDSPRIVIDENGGEVVEATPGFMIIATTNTWGHGDPSGLYGTTSILSEADMQRFTSFIELDYLPSDVEIQILTTKTKLKKEEATAFVKVANEIRAKAKEGKIDKAISPRQLINWANAHLDLGGEVEEAAMLSFLRAWPPEIQTAVIEIVKRIFPQV